MTETALALNVRSMVDPLRTVAMRAPGAILTADHNLWHYAKVIDADRLADQYQAFVDLVAGSGADIVWIDPADDGLADSVFTYDPSFVVGDQAIVLAPGKELREPEADLHDAFYRDQGLTVAGRIEAPGLVEGGDLFWIDATTLAAGRGFRTNQVGIDQLKSLVEPLGVTVEVYDLPYLHGPDACLHLLSVISPLDHNLALVHAPLMPTALYQRLIEAGYELLHAPEEEFEASLGLNLNVLAVAPRHCIAIDGFDQTLTLMRQAGCRVETFQADALCLPCEGGPTCLTRPLNRG